MRALPMALLALVVAGCVGNGTIETRTCSFSGLVEVSWTPATAPPAPGEGCLCLTTSGAPNEAGFGCQTIDGCGFAGFDLELGTPATSDTADVYLIATEDGAGLVQDVTLHAPAGIVVLPNTNACDVTAAPADGYTTSVTIGSYPGSASFAERNTTFVVKTSTGRYAKLSLECNCPSGGSGAGLSMMGMRFRFMVAPAGSTTLSF
jgi:hypothetical protein